VYISCCLAGRAYPLGDIPCESVARVRTDVLHCLTSLHSASGPVDEPLYPQLWTLIQFDTREFFNVLSLAFGDVGLTDVEKQGVVDILLRMMVDDPGFTQSQVTLCSAALRVGECSRPAVAPGPQFLGLQFAGNVKIACALCSSGW